jgi:hypothetical protein
MLVGVMDGDTDGTLTYGEVAAMSATTEGTLYIDLIDAKKKKLVWEGQGVGYLTQNREQKTN